MSILLTTASGYHSPDFRFSSCCENPELANVHNLSTLAISRSVWPASLPDLQPVPPETPSTIVELIRANAPSLQTVIVHGDALWNVPMPDLSDFALIDAIRLPALTIVLDSSNLTELRVAVLDAGIRELVTALAAAPDACPQLTSLKLICDDAADQAHSASGDMRPIARFIKNKRHMRRLHVVFYSLVRVDEVPLLDVLAELPGLETFGVDITRDPLRRDYLRLLDEKLPMQLTNMLLYSEFEYSEVTKEEITAVVSIVPHTLTAKFMIHSFVVLVEETFEA